MAAKAAGCNRIACGLARKRGPLAQNRREWSVERRFRGRRSPSHGEPAAAHYQGAPFGAPRPSSFEGREPKHQLAQRRENNLSWLFDM